MKSILLLLPLLVLKTYALDEMGPDLSRQLVSTIQDKENERKLYDSAEFKKCREQITQKKLSKPQDISEAASKCLQDQIKDKKTEELQSLSNSLNLTDYSLISSNNVKEISNYLQNKLYKSLTGIDPNDEAAQRKGFKDPNKKIIDQRDLFSLYRNHSANAALLAISSYCFNDLRLNNAEPTATSFGEHWGNKLETVAINPYVNDLGYPEFTVPSSANKNDVYSAMLGSLNLDPSTLKQGSDNTSTLNKFFMGCTAQIKKLCDAYKPGSSLGAKSCLVKNKLANYRKNIEASRKILEDPNGTFSDSAKNYILSGLQSSQASSQEDFANLANLTSTDISSGGKTDQTSNQLQKCKEASELPGCEFFIGNSGANDKIYDNTAMNITFRKEVELERIKTIQANKKELSQYLKDNGYLNLDENSDPKDILAAVAQRFDAERDATIEQLQKAIGTRQTADDAKSTVDAEKLSRAKDNAAKSEEERMRLAQVVLFNNIITSQLSLQDDKKNSLGRNLSPLKNELASAPKGNSGKDSDSSKFFTELQTSVSSGADEYKAKGNESVGSLTFIDNILGQTEK